MGQLLSEMLLANGFLMVLGTKEKSMSELEAVGYGVPYTFDSSNGYTAAYDEQGRPWWAKSSKGLFEGPELSSIVSAMHKQGVTMRRGAYVPHRDGLLRCNLEIANGKMRTRLLVMGVDAPALQVLAAWRYEFDNLGSYASMDLPKVCQRLGVHTIGRLMSCGDESITGPQAQYAGNKTLEWLKAVRGAFYQGSGTIFPSRITMPGGRTKFPLDDSPDARARHPNEV